MKIARKPLCGFLVSVVAGLSSGCVDALGEGAADGLRDAIAGVVGMVVEAALPDVAGGGQ